MTRLCAALLLGSLLPAPLLAQDDDAELAALLESVIEEETELATRTRMNADFVPGIVSVIRASEAQALGARTVGDALARLAGVEHSLDLPGNPTLAVRGIAYPFNNGNVLILLNGVPVSRESVGTGSAVLHFPLAQVERIEFVRGPGSVVYGDFAFQGLVNIVTERETRAFSTEWDDRGTWVGHGRWQAQAGDWRFYGNASVADGDATVPAGRAAELSEQYAVLGAAQGNFRVNFQGFRRDYPSADGLRPPLQFTERTRSLDARHSWNSSEALEWRLRGQWHDNYLNTDSIGFDGEEWRAAAEMVYSGWQGHTLLAGIEYLDGKILSADQQLPMRPGLPPRRVSIDPQQRDVLGLYLQDQFALSESLQLTVAARYDDNSEIGSRVSPRLALAWRLGEAHILKAQYAEGYRSPTFFELYRDENQPPLDFEVNRTIELNYVYRDPTTRFRATVYDARLIDRIGPEMGSFSNRAQTDTQGVELDLEKQFSPGWKWLAATAWTDPEGDVVGDLPSMDIAGVARWTGSTGLLWTPSERHSLGLNWRFADDRRGIPVDQPERYDLLDVSYQHRGLLGRGSRIQVGVQNLLDEQVSYFSSSPVGLHTFAYEERVWWLSVGWVGE
ncbi:MAG: TonB-dependent receptor [Xanthomonadales bacterium]|nr:TonB-dependent receptor [Xanthomonadales bacterium]